MPKCGSQIVICDLPVRFDTYKGCSHACSYCFVKRRVDISNIEIDEGPKSLMSFINGKRGKTIPFDWDIPIHWGGVSDPFQPCERIKKVSLECLKVFKETQYPFVVSTKGAKLIIEEPYRSLLLECNCVIQISAACSKYDEQEKGASTFDERMNALKVFSDGGKRVNIRVQPYMPSCYSEIYKSLEIMANNGAHGVIFESMKYQRKLKGLVKVANDYCFSTDLLSKQFLTLKKRCHDLGMKFYCGENRLRQLSDELCCCGIEGLGWKPNSFNLNHELFDKDGAVCPESIKNAPSDVFASINQDMVYKAVYSRMGFEECMKSFFNNKWKKSLLPDKK